MFERSEFGPRAPLAEKRRGPVPRSGAGSRPAEGLFGSFLVLQKGTRARSDRKLCTAPFACEQRHEQERRQEQSFRAVARVTFVLAKVTKTAIAGREPIRLRRIGPLCFSAGGARGPNSLRSDTGRSTTPPPSDARLA